MSDDYWSDLTPGGCLTLDLAGTTGWCYGNLASGDMPNFGTIILPRPSTEAARFVSLDNELTAAFETLEPSRVVIEAPLRLMAHTQLSVTQQQLGLRAIALAACYRASISVSEIGADLVRDQMMGRHRFSKGGTKREVVAFVRSCGLSIQDHNAADAAMIWMWARRQLAGIPPAAGPMFVTREI